MPGKPPFVWTASPVLAGGSLLGIGSAIGALWHVFCLVTPMPAPCWPDSWTVLGNGKVPTHQSVQGLV